VDVCVCVVDVVVSVSSCDVKFRPSICRAADAAM